MILFIAKSKLRKVRDLESKLPLPFNKKLMLATVLQWAGLIFFGLSILNLKGPPQRIKKKESTQRISFIADYSASMTAQDVGTSRYIKSLHFLSDTFPFLQGNELRLSIFGDASYKLVPFTRDVEFLENKIMAVEESLFPGGGSELHVALKELVLSDKNNLPSEQVFVLLSDFENVDVKRINGIIESNDLKVVLIGVGSKSGGYLPKTKNNQLTGFLSNKAGKIKSIFGEKNFEEIKSLKKFRLTSQRNPIDEFLPFIKSLKLSENNLKRYDYLRSRYFHYFLYLGSFLILVSLGIKSLSKLFGKDLVVLALFSFSQISWSVEELNYNSLSGLNTLGIKEIGEYISNKKEKERINNAKIIFKENIAKSTTEKNKRNSRFNLATAEILSGNNSVGIGKFQNIYGKDAFVDKKIRSNIINLLKSQKKLQKGGGGNENPNQQQNKKGKQKSGENSRSGKKRSRFKDTLSKKDRNILEKLIGDDQTAQGEYIKKKIRTKNSRGIKW